MCLDPRGSSRELSMFDKLDVRRCKDFELNGTKALNFKAGLLHVYVQRQAEVM